MGFCFSFLSFVFLSLFIYLFFFLPSLFPYFFYFIFSLCFTYLPSYLPVFLDTLTSRCSLLSHGRLSRHDTTIRRHLHHLLHLIKLHLISVPFSWIRSTAPFSQPSERPLPHRHGPERPLLPGPSLRERSSPPRRETGSNKFDLAARRGPFPRKENKYCYNGNNIYLQRATNGAGPFEKRPLLSRSRLILIHESTAYAY